jgi:hypothetical protein
MWHNPLLVKAVEIAATLLEIAGDQQIDSEMFPRNMVEFAVNGMEIPVIYRDRLSIYGVRQYVCALGGQHLEDQDVSHPDRELYGLLHIGPPTNLIMVRRGLLPHIVNFVIAHELGHFLADIYQVQRLWLKAFPERRLEVARAFSWQEYDPRLEMQALVKGLPERPREITRRGNQMEETTVDREILADLIGRELVAPWDQVIKHFRGQKRIEFVNQIHCNFGLPRRIAYGYYDEIRRSFSPRKNFIDTLFAPLLDNQKPKD